jgi:uncharacterized protein YcbK (DUF882 family)
MDPKLYDLLSELQEKLGEGHRMNLVCGHRTEKTNAALKGKSEQSGVASKSQHILGKAADITVDGISTEKLRDTALAMKKGGVGYYPKTGFVHVDTGRVRRW